MPRKQTRALWLVDAAQLEGLRTADLLDMFRYDMAQVHGRTPRLPDKPPAYLLTNEHGPTLGRWASFGVTLILLVDEQGEPLPPHRWPAHTYYGGSLDAYEHAQRARAAFGY